MWFKKEINLEKSLNFLIKLFLFLLPWQTIWIYKERYLNNFKWQFGTLGFYLTEFLLWILVVLFIIWFWRKKKEQNKNSFKFTKDRLFTISILIFIIYIFLSQFWALDSSLVWQQGIHILEVFLLFFILLLGPIKFLEIRKYFLAGAILTALLGIFQFVFQNTLINKWLGLVQHQVWQSGTSIVSGYKIGRWLRAYGTFSHPNILGGYLVVAMLALNLNREIKNKIYFFSIYTVLFIALFLTFSRSAWLAFIVIIVFYWLLNLLKKKNKFFIIQHFLLTILLLIILSLSLFPIIKNRFLLNYSRYEIKSITDRESGLKESWEIWRVNKWFGVGAGNYTLTVYKFNSNYDGWKYQPVHNVFMLILTELGIVGVLLLFFICIAYTFSFYVFIKKYWYLYFLFFISYLLISSFDHYLYSSYIGLLLGAVFVVLITRFYTLELHS